MGKELKVRDTYVDIAKAICIMLIVCIHTEVFRIVEFPMVYIAVPMFFFMSGFYDKGGKSFLEVLRSSMLGLLFPTLIWNIIGIMFFQVIHILKEGSLWLPFFDFCNPCVGNGPTWFLVALFYTKLFAFFINNLKWWVALVSSIFIGYLGSTYQMPLYFDEGLAALPLYCIGRLCYPHMKEITGNYLLNAVGLLCMFLFLIHILYYGINPLQNKYYLPYYLVGLIGVILSFIPMLSFCKKIKDIRIADIGKKSLGIMLIHILLCHVTAIIMKRCFEEGSTIWIVSFIFAYFMIVAISYHCTSFINKHCPILFGGIKR